jgi:signal transduction histidine kinase
MMNSRPDGPPNPQPSSEHSDPASLYNPYDLLGQADDLHARVSGLQAALDHHERLATLGTIAGLIAHEFNNILTPVMSYAQMALAKPNDRELATKALTKAVEGTERAASIAAAILGFVRDESLDMRTGRGGGGAGRASPPAAMSPDVPRGTSDRSDDRTAEADAPPLTKPPTPRCDVQSVIDETFTCLAREPHKDGIEVDVDVEPGLEAAARSVTLQHVILNLILNARNAMIPGGGRLTIRAYRAGERPRIPSGAASSLESEARVTGSPWNLDASSVGNGSNGSGHGDGAWPAWVIVEVSDNGRGMTPDQLANLFRPFYTTGARARDHSRCCGLTNCEGACDSHDEARSRSGGDRRTGTGLGMTICKRLLADCGGLLYVRSDAGTGTTAVVALPAVA